VQEEFLEYFIANTYLKGNYEFMRKMNFDLSEVMFNVSDLFLGNFWRLEALFMIKSKTEPKPSLQNIVQKLQQAEKHY